jgi:spore germination protein YaaH
MNVFLNSLQKKLLSRIESSTALVDLRKKMTPKEILWSFATVSLSLVCLLSIFAFSSGKQLTTIISPIIATLSPLHPLGEVKKGHEVFGFAPHWNLNKLDNVDFNTLTTFAYFGIPITAEGDLDTSDLGYDRFHSDKATEIFKKAHGHGTRVVLTITLMENSTIKTFLADPEARERAITQTVSEVKGRGIDGVNVDIEYIGNPGSAARGSYSTFIEELTTEMHKTIPGSYVTASVYASSAVGAKLYDIRRIGKAADGIFMMAYDFATTGSDTVIPTSPLYGYKEKKYWYDVSTAVEDFLKVMPAEKLILGLPWYGYNYPVTKPGVKVAKYQGYDYYYWYGRRRYRAHYAPTSNAQTYASASDSITAEQSGWDEVGKVGWKAYQEDGIWRMIFIDDERSLKLKYDFAKEKNLAGVGMWALGFDKGRDEMWTLLRNEFGEKLADSRITEREIQEGL